MSNEVLAVGTVALDVGKSVTATIYKEGTDKYAILSYKDFAATEMPEGILSVDDLGLLGEGETPEAVEIPGFNGGADVAFGTIKTVKYSSQRAFEGADGKFKVFVKIRYTF